MERVIGLRMALPLLAIGVFCSGRAMAQSAPAPASVAHAEAALSNEDVVKLVKLDLGDAVVIAKINQAPHVAFRLDTDDLVKLKQQQVGKEVIAAMLKRATAPEQGTQAPAAVAGANPAGEASVASRVGNDIRLASSAGETLLRATAGDVNVVGFSIVKSVHYEIPGIAARVRVPDKNARIVISADFPPVGYFFVVRLGVDKKHNNRSVKIGSVKQNLSFRSRAKGKPDKDIVVPCRVEEASPNKWQFVPEAPLEAGEYGVWASAVSQGVEQALYDFAVD